MKTRGAPTPDPKRMASAIHEASHAVLMLALGGTVEAVELIDDGGTLTGRCFVGSVNHLPNPPLFNATRELIVLLAPRPALEQFKLAGADAPDKDRQDAARLALKVTRDDRLALQMATACGKIAAAVVAKPDIQRRIAYVAATLSASSGRLDAKAIKAAITAADSKTTQETP